jgi:general secretion pathway protein D
MDRAPGEVLIEVVLAEITITDSNNLGIELGIGNNLRTGTTAITGGTSGGLGIGSSGLNLRLLDPGTSAQAVINALSKKTRVSILSNPRVVAKSGTDAHIQVGTQVPVLRQESTNVFTGQTGVTNTVDYIDTGVVLDVRPVIRADSRIDLEVSQEVSEAQTNDTSSINSPLIFTRSIKTQLSLNDNQTVLLGGLKSTNRSNTKSGIPGLKNLPVAGALFRSQTAGKTDTELLIFMTPQIVTQPAVSNELVARYKDTMRKWQTPSGSLEWW